MMNRRQLLSTASLSLVAKSTLAVEDDKAKAEKNSVVWLKKTPAHFAMAYYFEDEGAQDSRPVTDQTIQDMRGFYKKGDKMPQQPSLVQRGGLDVAGLVARTKKRVALSNEQLAAVAAAVFDGTTSVERFYCYDPHHIVVCYDAWGHPTGAIEVCLLCQGIAVFPGARPLNNCQDLVSVARILSKAGLPLGKEYPSIEAYEAQWKSKKASAK